jgi:hypothetical protein
LTKRVVDYDPLSGITTTFDYYHSTGITTVGSEQDVGPAIEVNKMLQNSTEYTKRGIKNSWLHEAFIPNIIIEKWKNEYGVNVFDKNDIKKVKALLNDPQYRYLKTTAGKI